VSLYDLSPPLSPAIAVWPGDTPFSIDLVHAISRGAPVNVSTMTLSTHTGSHFDAPFHVLEEGSSVDQLPLEPFIGPALLIDAVGAPAVDPALLEPLRAEPPERLLVRTRRRADPARFDEAYTPLAPAAAELLVAMGVRLYGTDAASIDPFGSETLDAHRILARGGVMILEGLRLEDPPPGPYELIALPLRIVRGDGSPVRAILRSRPAGLARP
jgi:arylformamidase